MAVIASAINGIVTSASRTLEAIRPSVHESVALPGDGLHRVREDPRHEAEDEQHAEDPQSVAGYGLPALGEGLADAVALDHDQRDCQHEPWPDGHAGEHEKDPEGGVAGRREQPARSEQEAEQQRGSADAIDVRPEPLEPCAERGLGVVVLVQVVDRLDEECRDPERGHHEEHDRRVDAGRPQADDEQGDEEDDHHREREREHSEIAPQCAVTRDRVVEDVAGAHAVRIDGAPPDAERGHPFEGTQRSRPASTAATRPARTPARGAKLSSSAYSNGVWSSPPTGPRPSSVGIPDQAVHEPSETPPVEVSPNGWSRACPSAMAVNGRGSRRAPCARAGAGRQGPPRAARRLHTSRTCAPWPLPSRGRPRSGRACRRSGRRRREPC